MMNRCTGRAPRSAALLAGTVALATLACWPAATNAGEPAPKHSIARQWNELLLDAIRTDFARPTIHARNLFHVSLAMWDSWAVYEPNADTFLTAESATAENIEEARAITMSYAVYRVLTSRFANSPGAAIVLPEFDAQMGALDPDDTHTDGDDPIALGNRIGQNVLLFGMADNSNEAGGYVNQFYEPVNPPLVPALPGNPDIIDPNRWQPLALEFFVDQSGNVIVGGFPEFLGPEWGIVTPFSLRQEDLTIYNRDGFDYWVYHDPGPPPYIGTKTEDLYKSGFKQVLEFSSKLDPTDGVTIDISPASRGNNTLGTNDGSGYEINPITGQPYEPQIVPAGDYFRILAEFWADGPASETPPGHWFTIANYVSDHPSTVKQLGGEGPILDDLEWDVKVYLALGGGMHDVAVAAWGVKGWYDFIRPISAIRYMCGLGQSTDEDAPNYDPQGIPLEPGLIEIITEESAAAGQRHENLANHIGEVAVKAWRGPDYVNDPEVDYAGVGWILAGNWWPYQRPSFVTPPFAGYVSGHSTYSRAAAEIMTRLTGSEFFPGGMGEFFAPQNEFLVFEEGPSVDCTLQWAKYYDASDECSISRIYGGIHPTADDIPGRFMGSVIGPEAFDLATRYYHGQITCPADTDGSGAVDVADLVQVIVFWGQSGTTADINMDGIVDVSDLLAIITGWGTCS